MRLAVLMDNNCGHPRTRLILAAERLIGERGLDAVTNKMINAEAGQRNESALHYHFGTRRALIEATLMHRVDEIDEARLRLHRDIQARDSAPTVRDLVNLVVLPLVELLGREGGEHYLRFVSQLANNPKIDFFSIIDNSDLPGLVKTRELALDLFKDLPQEIALMRRRYLILSAVLTLGHWTFLREQISNQNETAAKLHLAAYLDSLTGFLNAPVSAATRELLPSP